MQNSDSRRLNKPCVLIEHGEDPLVAALLAFAHEIDATFNTEEVECIIVRDHRIKREGPRLYSVKALQDLGDFLWSEARHLI